MATVTESSTNGPIFGPEDKLSSANRSNAGVHGTLTPNYVGEIVTDTTNNVTWVGTGTSANTDWQLRSV